jgi:hypothetical protein
MKPFSILYSVLVLAGVVLALLLTMSSGSAPAFAQPSPVPQECTCSPGVNIGSAGAEALIMHCQCGILSCAVVTSSGQLQCAR